MPLAEAHVGGRAAAAQWRVVHDIVLKQRERLQQLQARACTQGGAVGPGTAQPAQVHERRPQAFAAVDELDQHVGRDVDSGSVQLRHAPGGDEVGDM